MSTAKLKHQFMNIKNVGTKTCVPYEAPKISKSPKYLNLIYGKSFIVSSSQIALKMTNIFYWSIGWLFAICLKF